MERPGPAMATVPNDRSPIHGRPARQMAGGSVVRVNGAPSWTECPAGDTFGVQTREIG